MIIMKLFDAFGRKPTRGQMDVYSEWAEKHTENAVKKTVEHMIGNATKFPSIAELSNFAKLSKKTWTDYEREKCWFCDSTGYIPAIFKPEVILPILKNLACKCADGIDRQKPSDRFHGVRPYFEIFNDTQFQVEGQDYPRRVAKIHREMMRKYNENREGDWKPSVEFWEGIISENSGQQPQIS